MTARTALLTSPAVLHMAVIFVLSSIPDIGTLPAGASDKSWHAFGYGALGVLLLIPLADGTLARVTLSRALAAIALATAYGITDELHQWFVPGRSPDVNDVVADFAGAAACVTLVWLTAAARAWGILRFWPGRGTLKRDSPS